MTTIKAGEENRLAGVKRLSFRTTVAFVLALVAILAISVVKADTASAIGPIGSGETVELADGTSCLIFTSLGQTPFEAEVGSLHSVQCESEAGGNPEVDIFLVNSLEQTSGGDGSAAEAEFCGSTGLCTGTLSVPLSPGTWEATTVAFLNGERFEVSDTRDIS